MKGTVTRLLGKVCTVRADPPHEQAYECYLRGRLFGDSTLQFAVGDRVEFDPVDELHAGAPGQEGRKTGVIHRLLPRHTALHRPPKRREREPQLVAANLDQIVVVSALKAPPLKTGLIDRYLIIAHRSSIGAALCLNKVDLGTPSELRQAREELRHYQSIGYPVAFTSAKSGTGLDELRSLLKNKRSVLVGHSGVGKSKLAGRMKPGLALASSEVTPRGKGRHTTTVALLIPLDFGGELVDTPGVRELGITHIDREELASHFVEFEPHLNSCQFKSCSHIPEPGCAVKEAVEVGQIPRSRYQSYEHLYHELLPSRS